MHTRRVVLTGAASLAVSLLPAAAHAVDAPVVTDRVYLDVAVDNKILVRVPFSSPPQASLRPGPSDDMHSPRSLALSGKIQLTSSPHAASQGSPDTVASLRSAVLDPLCEFPRR